MIIPCIDLMGGKVVQLVQGREKALEGGTPLEMLQKFAAFREIQVIDLDAAMGQGSNDDLVELIASRCTARVVHVRNEPYGDGRIGFGAEIEKYHTP